MESSMIFVTCVLLVFSTNRVLALYGSTEVNIQDYPHHAAIEENTRIGIRFLCSGAILSPRVIVTVASCLEGLYHPSDLVVRVGSSRATSGGMEYSVSERHAHPSYSPEKNELDVAILKLKEPISWNQDTNSINLPRANYIPRYGSTAFASSWGSYEEGSYATTLRHTAFRVDRCDCNKDLNVTSTSYRRRVLCVSNSPSSGTCYHDEGAPLVEKGILVGLATAWGLGCSNHLNSVFVPLGHWEVRYFIDSYL